MPRTLTATLLIFALTMLPACGGGGHTGHGEGAGHNAFEEVKTAICVLSPTTGSELKGVSGTVTFTQTKDGLLVEAEVTGLTPNAKHGFHVHQWGDISDAETGKATGGHYNPGGVDHGLPGDGHEHGDTTVHMTGGHAGDFGNLEADATGKAIFSKTFENISLTGNNAVLGRGIIVHLKEDDGKGDTGNAGARVAQGVIGIANAEAEN